MFPRDAAHRRLVQLPAVPPVSAGWISLDRGDRFASTSSCGTTGEVLIYGLDPDLPRFLGGRGRCWHILLGEADRAGIGLYGPGHHLHQGGFAGAVVADQADDFTFVQVEGDPVQRVDGAVVLDDAGSRMG